MLEKGRGSAEVAELAIALRHWDVMYQQELDRAEPAVVQVAVHEIGIENEKQMTEIWNPNQIPMDFTRTPGQG